MDPFSILIAHPTQLPVIDKRWWWGGPRDLWLKNAEAIKDIITNSEPIPVETAHAQMLTIQSATETKLIPHRVPFPGGLRIPHLHFEGKVYAVKETTWREFSNKVIVDLQKRLDEAKNKAISFERLMELSEVAETLGT